MRLKTTIRGQILVLMLVPVILLVIGFAIALRLWGSTVEVTAKTDQAMAVVVSAQGLLEKVLDAETGVRGYVATGLPLFLEPYDKALISIPVRLQRLSTVVAGDVGQMRHMRRIEALSRRQLTILARYVRSMQAGRREQARADIARASGKHTMDELRNELGMLTYEVQRDEAARRTQTETASSQSRNALVFCIIIGIFLAAGGTWQMRRAIAMRVDHLVQKARRLAEGEDIGPALAAVTKFPISIGSCMRWRNCLRSGPVNARHSMRSCRRAYRGGSRQRLPRVSSWRI